MQKYDFVTIGGATEDITFYTDEAVMIDNKEDLLAQKLMAFEYGAKLGVEKSFSSFGGGASNAAVCFSKLGFKTAVIVAVGDDYRGKGIVDNFKKQKVNTKLIQRIKGIETGFTFFIVGKDREHVGFSNRAANAKLVITEKELSEIDKSKWVYLTSLSGKWQEILKNVFCTKAKIVWNPGHIQLHTGYKAIGKYLKKTDILTLNKDEAMELVFSNPANKTMDSGFLNDIKNLIKILKSYGPKIVVITNGKHGVYAYDDNQAYYQGVIHSKKTADTTGVGDAFGSTFAAGMEFFKGDIEKAMQAAIKNAASVVGEQGAQNGLLSKLS
ncbi:MAG: Sugar kinase, ribokinase family [Candidatus Falkowbacteria bacterium GW2011_GWC2_38_22]|uniref:Sugar kinase, ribokinase family n=1 Tax=Candidatus Falkowbacteria bacterium GW2011_GWE1_38_31 TaxID=1618638 RepID=A0A0G0M7K4_9BACT|nr:MAG: Sugar kinase, ribokinase family [Candidatus Falkowbacteria bacterium GW2011_GWF2_38_1205]KKQ60687.1 MAG: Sugar kinase, ribokinase family [Candidatus Falkowbacteria bacterium GW2011_GWC2_38_22]KKQ62827.1 MAG: Sugar kinase, ribokinase family [Candidatus Falkowbacteria bacterium GW2011_GWF1_38_22]KKQ64939.1 MAG: Sugar kinase, ribokinase family [Candidatus Falkowbacteria bacterium GW2011_GWE2_38_254]KKQ69659.1 MAG: Sugar kinase, ribokinase family [Candidatus Falkowbacteria bacterium GW2011_